MDKVANTGGTTFSATITLKFAAQSQLELDSRRTQLAALLEVVSRDFDEGGLTIREETGAVIRPTAEALQRKERLRAGGRK